MAFLLTYLFSLSCFADDIARCTIEDRVGKVSRDIHVQDNSDGNITETSRFRFILQTAQEPIERKWQIVSVEIIDRQRNTSSKTFTVFPNMLHSAVCDLTLNATCLDVDTIASILCNPT